MGVRHLGDRLPTQISSCEALVDLREVAVVSYSFSTPFLIAKEENVMKWYT